MSPKDTLPVAQAKMEAWIAGGVEVGWLIGFTVTRFTSDNMYYVNS